MSKRLAILTAAVMLLAALAVGLSIGAAGADEEPIVVPPPDLNPLNQTVVPEPPNLYEYVKNKHVAIQLGKAFFWEMQTGSDGIQACATCHFSAGADSRLKNTLNPGADGVFKLSDNRTVGPNDTLLPGDFPFHLRAGEGHLQSDAVLRDTDDVVGSQGVKRSQFVAIVVDNVTGIAEEITTPVADPVFSIDGVNVRQVTGRNTPTVINAVFNFTNFWDGRANFVFNGENPFGPADTNAGVWFNDPVEGLVKRPVRLEFASLASQATGPPMDSTEMSAAGRTFPELGRKLLNVTPLGKQVVSHDDSVLGGLANSAVTPGAKGLHMSYGDLIKGAFKDKLWSSDNLTSVVIRDGSEEGSRATQMEANFAFFWGLSIQLYEATLVSERTPFDAWLGGNDAALTSQQKQGFALFSGIAKCNICHGGIELTNASVTAAAFLNDFDHALIELMFVADGTQVIYDNGFNNTAVTRTTDDVGRGKTAPFTNSLTGQPYPLSFSALAQLRAQNLLPFSTPIKPLFVPDNFPVNANGAFKVPGLRNVALTAPYFHNGSVTDLDDVMDMYMRGGNFPVENAHDQDPDVADGLPTVVRNETMEHAVIAFLESLTDLRVAAKSAPFDHPELFVPEGSPDILTRIPATNSFGQALPPPNLTFNPVASPTNTANQTITGTVGDDLTPAVTVNTTATVGPVTVTGGNWSANVTGLIEGANVVTVSIIEGDVQTSLKATLTLDTVPPALTINPVTTPTALASQALSGTKEDWASVRVSVNGGAPVAASTTMSAWSFSAALNQGGNTVSVTATDAAGNTTTLPPVTIVVDPQAAVLSFNVNLAAGWNSLSTPVRLQTGAQTLGQVFDEQSQLNMEILYRWDVDRWRQLGASDTLAPLEAIFVKVNNGSTATATFLPSADLTPPPSRNLQAGLNLVGIAPSLVNDAFPTQPLGTALTSVAQAPGGVNGYTMVLSPGYNQPGWTYALGGQAQNLLPFRGYWVIMDNADTLYGFSTTPLR
ncbi:MAG: hypothetical protein HYX91_00280 [Chloroflexi bacterium]|nr:hypothetical protein [Chloroflexota bacterium]